MATKRKPQKKGSVGKTLLVLGLVGGAGYALYEYVLKPYLNKDSGAGETPPVEPVIAGVIPPAVVDQQINTVVATADTVKPNASGLDTKLTLKRGDDNPEVKSAQVIFNDIIDKCRKGAKLPFAGQSAVNPKMTVARVNQIADLTQLTTDGNFGGATEKVAQVIMGKSTFTLAEARAKRIAIYAAFNLASPY